jgi:predicted transcriptional regulator of viral defense system
MREELVAASRSHHALLRGAELRKWMTPQQLRTCITRGELERVYRDVYRLRGAPSSRRQQLLAAVYRGGRAAVGSHRSCAALWGMLDRWPATPEISIPSTRRVRVMGVTVHRSEDLCDEFVTAVDGIPVTVPAFTILDLGAVCGVRTVEGALERATVLGLATVDEIEALHRRLRRSGRSGSGALGMVLDDLGLRGDDIDSRLEHAMARLWKRFDLPQPVYHYVVHDDRGVPIAEADFAYPHLKLIIEVDGFDAHGSPKALQMDLARQNLVVLQGWTVLRFTWNDVTKRPAWVAKQIRHALRTLNVA